MIDQEFIQRAQELYKDVDNRAHKRECDKNWQKKNSEIFYQSQKKYLESDKGKYAATKRNIKRYKNFKNAIQDLSWEEEIYIGRFYKNCPIGFEVDHIVPISKGGKHKLSNLQYLTREDNRKKSGKLSWSKEQMKMYFECD